MFRLGFAQAARTSGVRYVYIYNWIDQFNPSFGSFVLTN